MADETLPAIGTKAVKKEDHEKSTGPVWQVTAHKPGTDKPIHINHAAHKLNTGLKPPPEAVKLTATEFKGGYVEL